MDGSFATSLLRRSPGSPEGAILMPGLPQDRTRSRRNRHWERHGLSLISFHRILIAFAILFCAGYGVWELSAFVQGAGTESLLISGLFFVFTAGLAYYLWRLSFFLGTEE